MAGLTRRFDDALLYAHAAHASQSRKGTGAPYIGHLLGVTSIVLDAGGSEDEAIAALLHDAAEDAGGRERLADIRANFGPVVAKIVEDCTDSWATPREPWPERKKNYLKHARTLDASSLRVWDRFNASPDDVLAYYQGLVRAYREAGGSLLVDELERIVRGIEREMGY
jgi:(p)ppGpp synthase/HD superfamily hydrolase